MTALAVILAVLYLFVYGVLMFSFGAVWTEENEERIPEGVFLKTSIYSMFWPITWTLRSLLRRI